MKNNKFPALGAGKGVAPILATVLIVLVVIALAGTFLIWSGRTITTTTERGTQEAQRISSQSQEGVEIVAMSCGTDQLTIRNSGSLTYDATKMTVFVNDVLQTNPFTDTSFTSNEVQQATLAGIDPGETIRVVTPGGAADSARCP